MPGVALDFCNSTVPAMQPSSYSTRTSLAKIDQADISQNTEDIEATSSENLLLASPLTKI
jgi:hypothetical protein